MLERYVWHGTSVIALKSLNLTCAMQFCEAIKEALRHAVRSAAPSSLHVDLYNQVRVTGNQFSKFRGYTSFHF